jgi:hypothetical protein
MGRRLPKGQAGQNAKIQVPRHAAARPAGRYCRLADLERSAASEPRAPVLRSRARLIVCRRVAISRRPRIARADFRRRDLRGRDEGSEQEECSPSHHPSSDGAPKSPYHRISLRVSGIGAALSGRGCPGVGKLGHQPCSRAVGEARTARLKLRRQGDRCWGSAWGAGRTRGRAKLTCLCPAMGAMRTPFPWLGDPATPATLAY